MPTGVYPRKPLKERFWEKVDVRGPDECWPWMAGHSSGYGMFDLTHTKCVRAHRLAYELVKGPIPDGLDVCHSCDNRPCCNPAHLWPGTQLDNRQDCLAKGRWAPLFGEYNNNAKLTDAKVREIRRMHSDGYSQRAIGQLMGVSHTNIGHIVRGETWRHVL